MSAEEGPAASGAEEGPTASGAEPDGGAQRRSTLSFTAVLALAMLATYWGAFSAGFVYDDLLHVVDEPRPATLGQLARIFAEPMSPLVPYYRPLARLANVAQKALHGLHPLPFHALNLALGFACALALRALLRTPALGASAAAASFAALLFALHPLASECVYPIASGRETLLPTLFTLLALGAYLRGTQRGRAAAILCFALGLLSKEQAIATPLLLALADALRIAPSPPRGARAIGLRYAPHAAVALAYVALRAAVIPAGLGKGLALLDAPDGPLLALLYHLQTTFAPFAEVIYEPRAAVWWSLPRVALALLAAGALALAALRCDARRALWLGALTLLSLAPTANLLVQETRFAERWGFAALAGWAGMLALLATHHVRGPRRRRLAGALGLAVVLACGALSHARGAAYRDDEAFLAQWLRSDPAALQPWISRGEARERSGDLDGAIAAYRHALALDPDAALAHASLAIALAGRGQLAGAERHARRALALDPADAESWSNLGGIRAQRGDLAGAIESYERALALRPRLASAHSNLGSALRVRGEIAAARAHFETALEIDPDFPEAHANLGDLLGASGDLPGARRHLEAALALAPDLEAARQALARYAPPDGRAQAR